MNFLWLVVFISVLLANCTNSANDIKPIRHFKSASLYSLYDSVDHCFETDIDMYVTSDTILFIGPLYNIGYDPGVIMDSAFMAINAWGQPVEMIPRTLDSGENILMFIDREVLVVLSTGTDCIELK